MDELYVRDILRVCGGKLLSGSEDILLGNFCNDTRKINRGDVYIAIRGEVFDGNKFYREAIDKGASVCILDNVDDNSDFGDATVVKVNDVLKAVQELAKYKRSMYDIPVIAVTGSVGKTSTKDIIASVVSRKYKTCKTIGNYNNHIGVPLTILSLKEEEALVVEMGMNHLREIAVLSEIAKPTISVITNVGTAHIGILGSRENILKAKLEILEGMKEKRLVINLDNDMLNSVYDELDSNCELYTVGIKSEARYKAVNIREDVFESIFDIDKKTYDVKVNVGGEVFVYNALVAYAVGDILGVSDSEIKRGINDFKLSSGRLERKVNSCGVTIIDDTYNANYDSMSSSLGLLGKVKDKRKVAILGDMLELGEYSDEVHTKMGEVVVDNGIDVLITVGVESIKIRDRAISLGFDSSNCYHFKSVDEVSDEIINLFDNNDIVLLKGSHGIHLEKLVDRMMKL